MIENGGISNAQSHNYRSELYTIDNVGRNIHQLDRGLDKPSYSKTNPVSKWNKSVDR